MRWAARLLRPVSSPRPAAHRARLSVLSLEGREVPSGTPVVGPAEPDTVVKADPPARTNPCPTDEQTGPIGEPDVIKGEPANPGDVTFYTLADGPAAPTTPGRCRRSATGSGRT